MGSNKTIYSKLPKVRLDIFMPWAIRAAVATALIMWSNELEKWWLGGCMAERYSWQLSSAQSVECSRKMYEMGWAVLW